MGAVARAGLQLRLGGGWGKGVGVMNEEVAEVEGVGDWFGDGYGAVGGGLRVRNGDVGGSGGEDLQAFWFVCGFFGGV